MKEEIEFFLEENSMSQTHLIHVSIDMKHFHRSLSSADFVELPILMLFKQLRFPIPDRLIINVILTWFPMAIGSLGGLNDGKNL